MTGQPPAGDGRGVQLDCPGVGYWVGPVLTGLRVGSGPGVQVGTACSGPGPLPPRCVCRWLVWLGAGVGLAELACR